MNSNKKQASILDFFKSKTDKNPISKVVVLESPCEISLKGGQETPIGHEVSQEMISKEAPSIDVNLIENNLFEIIMENCVDDDISTESDSDLSLSINDSVYNNFNAIMKTILFDDHYNDLLSEEDCDIIQEFTCLAGPVQLLYLKLYMRKRIWIRKNTIHYADVNESGDYQNELSQLVQHKFLIDASCLESIEETLDLMKCGELKDFVKTYNGFNVSAYKFCNKKSTITRFMEYVRSTKPAFDSAKTIEQTVLNRLQVLFSKDCFKINSLKASVFDRIFLLYMNPISLLDDFDQWHRNVLDDHRVLNQNDAICQTNKAQFIYYMHFELLEFSNAFNLVCRIMNKIAMKEFKDIVDQYFLESRAGFSSCYQQWHVKDQYLSVHLRPLTATGMYLRAINEILTALEKVHMYQEYVDILQNELLPQTIYGTNYRPHWYIRAASISHFHLKNLTLAKTFCNAGLDDSFVRCGNRLELYNILVKLESSSNIKHLFTEFQNLNQSYHEKTIYAEFKNIENDTSRKNFYFVTLPNGDVNLMSVEDIVIRHYLNNGYTNGIHTESVVYFAFFALFMWDIIYSTDVNDSFRFYKQLSPLDLNYESFYERRKDSIELRIIEISKFSESELITELILNWNRNYNKSSSFINWNDELLQQLMEIANCFTAKSISLILQVMARDFKNYRKGFPDLIVWDVQSKRVKLIEVKSLRDRLSTFQTIWLSTLSKFGLDVELCNVKPKPK